MANKLITDRPRQWKDFLVGMIEEIDKGFGGKEDIQCVGLLIISRSQNEDNLSAYYNTRISDKMVMRGMVDTDIMDMHIRENYFTDDEEDDDLIVDCDLDMGCSDS